MNYPLALFLAGGAYLAFTYLPIAKSLLRLEFGFHHLDIIKIETDSIHCGVTLRADNPTAKSLLLQSVQGVMSLNGTNIGTFKTVSNTIIRGRSYGLITILFTIEKATVGKSIWSMIINKQTDFVFKIQGSAIANDQKFPLVTSWTMQDIILLINN